MPKGDPHYEPTVNGAVVTDPSPPSNSMYSVYAPVKVKVIKPEDTSFTQIRKIMKTNKNDKIRIDETVYYRNNKTMPTVTEVS